MVRKRCVRILPLSFFLLYYSNAFTTIAWRWTKAKMRNDNKFVFEFQPKTTRYSIFFSFHKSRPKHSVFLRFLFQTLCCIRYEYNIIFVSRSGTLHKILFSVVRKVTFRWQIFELENTNKRRLLFLNGIFIARNTGFSIGLRSNWSFWNIK